MTNRCSPRSRRAPVPLLLLVASLFLFFQPRTPEALAAQTVLVPAGAFWRYLDNGSDQGAAWRAPAFSDSAWASGPAQLGYGDGNEATVVGYGPDPNNKYVTTYFRLAFTIADPSLYRALTLKLLRDDGAVVYLNGTEVFRSNMPAGAISYRTLASNAIAGTDENTFYAAGVSPSLLVSGRNVLAVEVHQASVTSSDISFDLELVGSDTDSVTRGPYLQMGTPTSLAVRWRTSAPSDSRVRYGPDPASLIAFADAGAVTTEHQVTLSGLLPDARYYYAIGTTMETLAGGDANHFFITPPAPGTAKPTRIWVVGDSGTADANAAAVRDAYRTFTGSRYTDVWLMLGDNAYANGTDAEYQAAVFDLYPSVLQQTVLWPTFGNHDGISADSATQTGPYYNIFTLPKQAEAGGLASGTEAYYSFDYGNIHFINLDAAESNRSATGPMMTWLRNDLAANTKQWVIAFWHHPPYSKGSHNSDTDIELIEMRQNALPILEASGVDLVLAGHSHSYERSFLLDGHYGTSDTLTASMKKDGGNGREDGSGAYRKPSPRPAPHEGAVYVVAGDGGALTCTGLLNHPAMFTSTCSLGSVVLDIDGNRLDARLLDITGATRDHFTLIKGGPLPPSTLTATPASTSQINLAWTDNAFDENGFKIERSLDGITFTQIGSVGANITTYSNTGLAASQTYSYRVRAHNATGDSAYSNTASATPVSLPDLVVTAVSNPPGTASAGSSFSVIDTTANTGTNPAGASTTRYRLSLDAAITGADPLLTGTRAVPGLAAGAGSTGSITVTIPSALSPGTYFLGACADDLGAVAESNETNNCRASTTTITVVGSVTLGVSPSTVPRGGTVTATWSGIPTPTSTDWIGLYVQGSANTAFVAWIYVSCSQTPGAARAAGSCSFGVPATAAAGSYELRLFANNGFTRLATSNGLTINP